MNNIVLIGRLTKDPVLYKSAQDGSSITKFNIAVDTGIDKDGNKITSFFTICAFKNTADTVVKYCKKGHKIGVIGRIQQRTYVNKENQNVTIYETLANSIELLENKKEENVKNVEPDPVDTLFEPTPYPATNNTQKIEINDDDLPF